MYRNKIKLTFYKGYLPTRLYSLFPWPRQRHLYNSGKALHLLPYVANKLFM